MKLKEDPLIFGGLSGSFAGLVQAGYAFTMKYFHLTDRTFVDFSKVLYMYKPKPGLFSGIIGLMVHLALTGVWGVGFAYIIKLTSDNYYYQKGLYYGVGLWLFIGSAGTIFNLPLFKDIPPNAALVTFGGGIIYGLSTAFILRLIERKFIEKRSKW